MNRRQALRTTLTMAAAADPARRLARPPSRQSETRCPGQHALRQSGRRRRECRRQRRAASFPGRGGKAGQREHGHGRSNHRPHGGHPRHRRNDMAQTGESGVFSRGAADDPCRSLAWRSRLAHRANANPDPYPAAVPNVERPTGFARRRSRRHVDRDQSRHDSGSADPGNACRRNAADRANQEALRDQPAPAGPGRLGNRAMSVCWRG